MVPCRAGLGSRKKTTRARRGARFLDRPWGRGLVLAGILLWCDGLRGEEPVAGHAPDVVIAYTGDTHATLEPCDCPVRPWGGMARRAALLSRLRAQWGDRLLYMDAGGAAAGGVFDPQSGGEEVDRLRTAFSLSLLRGLGCAALAVGDEELAAGPAELAQCGLPLLGANVAGAAPATFRECLVVTMGDREVVLLGASTLSSVFPPRESPIDVQDPVRALREAVDEALRAHPRALLVLLGHVGPAEARRIARDVPELDLVLAAHQVDEEAVWEGETLIVGCAYQGRELGLVEVGLASPAGSDRPRARLLPRRLPLDARVPDDPETLQKVEAFQAAIGRVAKRRVRVEVFLVADGIPGLEALILARRVRDRLAAEQASLQVDVQPRYLGASDLAAGRHLAAVYGRFPSRFADFVRVWREQVRGTPWEDTCRNAGIDPHKVAEAIASARFEETMAADLHIARSLGVQGDVAVFVDGRRVRRPDEISEALLLGAVCSRGSRDLLPAACRDLPECFDHEDCRKPGYIAECRDSGGGRRRCIFVRDVDLPVTVLMDPSSLFDLCQSRVGELQRTFPGLQPVYLDVRSEAGRRRAAELEVEAVPAFVFPPEVEQAGRFGDARSRFLRREGCLLLDPSVAGASLFFARGEDPGRLDCFVGCGDENALRLLFRMLDAADPVRRGEGAPIPFAEAGDARGVFFRMGSRGRGDAAPRLFVHPLVYVEPDGRLTAMRGLSEVQASQRVASLLSLRPDAVLPYLRELRDHPGDGYWEDRVAAVGVDPAELKHLARSPEIDRFLRAEAALAAEFAVETPFFLVGNNREVIYLRDNRDVEEIVDRLREQERARREGGGSGDGG